MTRVVLKLGGRVAAESASRALELHAEGLAVAVVHGAGPQITAAMRERGVPVRFVQGRRVTTAAALEVVRTSLLEVNSAVCAAVGELAVPLAGDEIGLEAARLPELGLVGDPLPCAPAAVVDALAAGRIPVVLPLARGPLNVNADEAAAALAVGLGASRIVFASDVPGVLLNGGVADELPADAARQLLREGAFEGGIVPKLLAAVHSAGNGIRAEIGTTIVSA
jgi:acetylglutamate kinase